MNAKVALRVTQGEFPGQEYVFDGHTVCTLGRSEDCSLHLPNDLWHQDVSRHHCLFDIDPPRVRVRDLGSRNGTFVNDQKIGQRAKDQAPETVLTSAMPECVLHNGDDVKVGGTIFQVEIAGEEVIEAPAYLPDCEEMLVGASL